MGEKIGIGTFKEKIERIYMIANAVSRKIYIGSAVGFRKRFGVHKGESESGTHINPKNYDRQGLKDFSFNLNEVEKKIEIGTFKDKVAGIYKIVNLVNGKIYIGSTDGFKKRFSVHKSYLNSGKHPNHQLQKDYDLLGEKAFRFEPIEVLTAEDCEDGETFEDMFKRRESYWAKQFNTHDSEYGYNLAAMSKGKTMNEETREKMSESKRGEKHPGASLNDMQVEDICKRLIGGEKGTDLAKEFKVHQATISAIKGGKTWRYITKKYLKQMRDMVMSDIDVAKAQKLLQQGMKGKDIAERLNISESSVSQIKNNRRYVDSSNEHLEIKPVKTRLTEAEKDEIWDLLKQGNEEKEIAGICNVSVTTISAIKTDRINLYGLDEFPKIKPVKKRPTEAEKDEILDLLKQGKTQREIAMICGVSQSTVSAIKNNRANFSDSDEYMPIMSAKEKLTDAKVDEILNLLHQGKTQKEIAKMFGVSQPAISVIKNHKGNFNVSRSPLQAASNS